MPRKPLMKKVLTIQVRDNNGTFLVTAVELGKRVMPDGEHYQPTGYGSTIPLATADFFNSLKYNGYMTEHGELK